MLLNASELVAKSWREYRENWHNWAVFGLLLFIPTFIITLTLSFGNYLNTYFPAASMTTNIITIVILLASAFAGIWGSFALINAGIKFLQTKKTTSWKEHYEVALKIFWPAFYTSVMAALAVMGLPLAAFILSIFTQPFWILLGIIFLIVPGIIFSVWYYFTAYNVFVNNEKGWAALESSKKLVRGRWWSVAWRILAPSVLIVFVLVIIEVIIEQVVSYLPITLQTFYVIQNLIQSVLTSFATPLSTLIWLNLFYSLRDNPFREPPILLSSEPPTDR